MGGSKVSRTWHTCDRARVNHTTDEATSNYNLVYIQGRHSEPDK